MRVETLRLAGVRILAEAELELAAGGNLIIGANGSGKSSVLEGLFLLSSGRSFRPGRPDAWVRKGSEQASCWANLRDELSQSCHGLGWLREGRGWQARVDGEPVQRLSELFAHCPVLCFTPESGELILGATELRRRFLDWGLFHVEPEFLPVWRRFQRALRQRNLDLRRRRVHDGGSEAWLLELARAGEQLHRLRLQQVSALQAELPRVLECLLSELGPATLEYRPGWPSDRGALLEVLKDGGDNDLKLGFTGLGPQRAGWQLSFSRLPRHEHYSRGQAKLAALAMLLAQRNLFRRRRGQAPILCLDDLAAELDRAHRRRVLDYLQRDGGQFLVTAVEAELLHADGLQAAAVFHVEQGRVVRQV